MFFVLSKILWAMVNPATLIAIAIIGGWLARTWTWGRRGMSAGVIALIIFGFTPIGHNLLVYWENRYPVVTALPPHVDGIIVLGGAIDFKKSYARGQAQLNMHAPRITEMMALAKKYPDVPIILSGGNGNLTSSSSSEAIELKKLFDHIGFKSSRLVYEGQSRNTYENMIYSRELAHPKEGDVWILVTSAFHMQRSEAIFTSHGWAVLPYPSGYITDGIYRFYPNLDILDNMFKLQVAAKEIIGIIAYRFTGKIG